MNLFYVPLYEMHPEKPEFIKPTHMIYFKRVNTLCTFDYYIVYFISCNRTARKRIYCTVLKRRPPYNWGHCTPARHSNYTKTRRIGVVSKERLSGPASSNFVPEVILCDSFRSRYRPLTKRTKEPTEIDVPFFICLFNAGF